MPPRFTTGLGLSLSMKTEGRTIRESDLFWTALMFYSRIPAPRSLAFDEELLNKSRKYFPLVGNIIAALACLALIVAISFLPLTVSILVSMAITILATGAFHEDGFCDTCDAMGGGWDKSQVLEIMKDSRLGTYGTVAIIILLGMKFTSLLALAEISLHIACLSIFLAHSFSRISASLIIDRYEYVQDLDKSKIKPIARRGLSTRSWVWSILISAMPGVLLFWAIPSAAWSIPIALATSFGFAKYCHSRIGGYTGDTLGASQQLSEVSIYLFILTQL